MKLTSTTTATITTNTYIIEHEEHGVLVYIEYLNEKGRVIDTILRTADGEMVDDPVLNEEVEAFLIAYYLSNETD